MITVRRDAVRTQGRAPKGGTQRLSNATFLTTERVIAGDRAIQVTRVQITDAGRQALDRHKARR